MCIAKLMQTGSYHSRGVGNKTTILPPDIAANSAEQVPFFPPPVNPTLTRPASGLCSAPVSQTIFEQLSTRKEGKPVFGGKESQFL